MWIVNSKHSICVESQSLTIKPRLQEGIDGHVFDNPHGFLRLYVCLGEHHLPFLSSPPRDLKKTTLFKLNHTNCINHVIVIKYKKWFLSTTEQRQICMFRFVQPQSPETVRIQKKLLRQLDLFQSNPDLASSGKYTIKCDVDPTVVDLFFARVGGDKTEVVTQENAEQLQALCDELGFAGFEDEIRATLGDGYMTKKALRTMQATLDEQNILIESQKQDFRDCWDAVGQLGERVTKIEDKLDVLFGMLDDMKRKMPKPADEAITAVKAETCVLRQELDLLKSKMDSRRPWQSEVKIEVKASPSAANAASPMKRRNTLPHDALAPDASCPSVAATLTPPVTRMKRSATEPELLGNGSEFPYDQASPFEGIISYLTSVCKGNVHKKGVVVVTASSCWGKGEEAFNVVDIGSDSCFQSSKDGANQWIAFDFKDRRVTPTSYSARSGRGNYPKSWVLEVSNEGCEESHWWTMVDRRNNEFALKGSNKTADSERMTSNFQIKPVPQGRFRFVRLRLTGKNFSGNDVLLLSSLEIFGTLYE